MKPALRHALWALAILTGLAGIGLAIAWTRAAPERPRFRTAVVTAGPITQVVLASGTLQPVTTVSVGTQVSGTVLERLADFNDRVRKGQVLLRLDPAALQARLRQARAQLASAQASLALSDTLLERNLRLNAEGFIAATALAQSQREHEAARANADSAAAQVDAALADLNSSVIRSPVDGIVIRRNIDVGQTVAASFQTPDLFQLAQDLRRMLIHASVAENDVGMVRPGQEVRFSVDAYPEREFDGTVTQIRLNATSTQGVVTYVVVVEVANPGEQLKPGMTALTRIVVATKPQVLRIPAAALRFRPDDEARTPVAFVPEGSDAEPVDAARHDGARPAAAPSARIRRVYTVGQRQQPLLQEVTVGLSNQRFAELVGGPLKEGDEVIVQAADPAGPGKP